MSTRGGIIKGRKAEERIKPSIIDGVASVIDLFGVYAPYDDISFLEETDQQALESDIAALQRDAAIAFAGIKARCQKSIAR